MPKIPDTNEKMSQKMIRILDKIEDYFILLLCVLLLLTGVYSCYDSFCVYYGADDKSLLKFQPGSTATESDRPITHDMVAWLSIDDADIEFPIVQGKDNVEYLNKDVYGDYSLSGSIFLDSRNSYDFSDEYSLVYGHHMENQKMFGKLDKYLDENFFKKHRTGTLTVVSWSSDDAINYDIVKEYQIDIFAVMEVMATESSIFGPTEVPISDTWAYAKSNADILDMSGIDESKQLLGLSTCKYPDTNDRTVIMATLTESNQNIS